MLWELATRSPVLAEARLRNTFTSVGGGVIFLETIIGAPLMRLALLRAGETFVDKLGKACILGAEGAPPVITLKLIDWEVRAGENSSRVGKVLWTVRDEETVSEVTEGALKRILLKVKPDAYVSMMQA